MWKCPSGGQIFRTSAPVEGKICMEVPQWRANFAWQCSNGGQVLRKSVPLEGRFRMKVPQWRTNCA